MSGAPPSSPVPPVRAGSSGLVLTRRLALSLGALAAAPRRHHPAAPAPVSPLGSLTGITVSPVGQAGGASAANNGAMFGPDTAGTATQGLQEAVTYAISQVQGVSGLVAPPVLLLQPGVFDAMPTITIPAPSGTGANTVGFEIAGSGHLATQVRFSSGSGFHFGQYAWQDVVIRDVAIHAVNGGTAASLVTVDGTGPAFPGDDSLLVFDHVWFEMPADPGQLPPDGAVCFRAVSGQAGGFTLVFTDSVIAGSFSVTSPFPVSFANSIVCSGTGCQYVTSSPLTVLGPGCWVNCQVSLTGSGQCLTALGVAQWACWAPALVTSAAATSITVVKIRDCDLVWQQGSGAVITQAAGGAMEVHFDGNGARVLDGGLYTLVRGSGYLTNSSSFGANYPLGTYGGPGAAIQGTPLAANPPAAGAWYQNTDPVAVQMAVPVTYSPTARAAATCVLYLGTGTGAGAFSEERYPAGFPAGVTATLRFRVPAGWWWKLAVANAVIGTAAVLPEQ